MVNEGIVKFDSMGAWAKEIINICRVMRALPEDEKYNERWKKLLRELQDVSVSPVGV